MKNILVKKKKTITSKIKMKKQEERNNIKLYMRKIKLFKNFISKTRDRGIKLHTFYPTTLSALK